MRRRGVVVSIVAGALVVGLGSIAMSAGPFEQPSEGYPFAYFGTAQDASDPDMPESTDNDVALFDTTSGEPVGMHRKLGEPGSKAGEQVVELDNQLGFKVYMLNRECGAGSPRIQLAVDEDGDGDVDGQLHGHVRPPYNNVCPDEKWLYEDLTDDQPRWEIGAGLTGTRSFPFYTWTEVETLLGAAWVTEGMLIEDSQAFAAQNRGQAFYDLVTIGNRTFEDHNDSAEGGERNAP